jgi:hypothetical protein
LKLRQFPFSGLLALFTLLLWSVIWLGFGWIHRLEWLFVGRPRRGRHARRASALAREEMDDA